MCSSNQIAFTWMQFGLLAVGLAFIQAGITKDNYEAEHKNCCGKSQQSNAPPVIEATAVEVSLEADPAKV